jgi:Icc-related predicted phosphoesterase
VEIKDFNILYGRNMTVIAVTSDVHSPKYLDLFKSALLEIGKPDLFLIVGDLVLKNDFTQLPRVLSAIRDVYDGPIIACFGNEEYEESYGEYEKFTDVIWLKDERREFNVKGKTVAIVGSKGSLDRPTYWQWKHIRGIQHVYRERINIIDKLLEGGASTKIVITHYAPTYKTLVGERRRIWPEMACEKLEKVILRRGPDLWFHGHAHLSKVSRVRIGKTLVVNASLPALKRMVVVDDQKKYGLDAFIGKDFT